MSEPYLVRQARKGRLEALKALRNILAREIGNGGYQMPSLAKQLRETMAEIDQLERLVPRGSIVDDLVARRAARLDAAADSDQSAGGAEQ